MSSKDSLIRLNRAIAQAGICSRRKADELIRQGRVKVNGDLVTEHGLQVDPARDRIEVDDASIQGTHATSESSLYLMLHKPPKVVTTLQDPQGRRTVLDLLPRELASRRPVPVGRLDFMSEGLLLLSTDGDFVHRLTHPRFHLPKVYEVLVTQNVADSALKTMRHGMRLQDGTALAPVEVEILHRGKHGTLLRLTLMQGLNRQIRRMCKDLRLSIRSLRRVAQGPVQLGTLDPGKWRRLQKQEIAALKEKVDL